MTNIPRKKHVCAVQFMEKNGQTYVIDPASGKRIRFGRLKSFSLLRRAAEAELTRINCVPEGVRDIRSSRKNVILLQNILISVTELEQRAIEEEAAGLTLT